MVGARASKIPRIGVAGWNLPTHLQPLFPAAGSHLAKYAAALNGVEINSCFYRVHKPDTYRRWADTVPEDFLFSLKLLKHFTHEKRLRETGEKLREVLTGHAALGRKWGALLIQLPPSLAFDRATVDRFLGEVRELYPGSLYCEPRHLSWAGDDARETLARWSVSRVHADPEPCPARHAADENLYLRMHGSPEIYRSDYPAETLATLGARLRAAADREAWCIFDNTTFGHAVENALGLSRLVLARETPAAHP